MYSGLAAITIADLTPLVGQIVAIKTATKTISRGMFAAAADPVVVTVVNPDGTPVLSNGNPVAMAIALADILSVAAVPPHVAFVPANPSTGAVQASAMPTGLIALAAAGIGAFVLYRVGFFGFLGLAPAGRRKKGKK